jgi:excisionase family DNA binding protein
MLTSERTYTAAEIVALLTLPERVERLERQVAELTSSKLKGTANLGTRGFAGAYVPSQKSLFSKKEAAGLLSVSIASLDILIARGDLKHRRFGRRILIPGTEIDRLAKTDIVEFWPAKEDGKTVRK